MNTVKYTVGGALAVIGLVMAFAMWPLKSVPAGHVGVVTMFGKVDPNVLKPGLNFVNPMSKVIDMNVQTMRGDIDGDAASHDLQHVHTKLTLNYHINENLASKLYSSIGMDYSNRVLFGPSQEALKAVTANYTAEELISKREDVRKQITGLLREKVNAISQGTIVIDDVFITNFAFSQSFNSAIEAKQEAEQLALKAKRDLERVRVEAEQKITVARAEAESLRVQKQEITPDLIKLREIEAQREAIRKWNGQLPQFSGSAMPFINIGK